MNNFTMNARVDPPVAEQKAETAPEADVINQRVQPPE